LNIRNIRAVAFGPNPVFPTTGLGTFENYSLLGSLSLLLFATNGSVLADISGQSAFGKAAANGTGEVPIPATLP
jgi:hypothetical protein